MSCCSDYETMQTITIHADGPFTRLNTFTGIFKLSVTEFGHVGYSIRELNFFKCRVMN